MDDDEENYGFYTTRYVSARNEESAEFKCLAKLKKNKWLKSLRSDEQSPAMVHFEEIDEVKVKFWKLFGKGHCFYKMSLADEFGGHADSREVEIEAHKEE